MQAAFHQKFSLRFAQQLDSFHRGRMAMWNVDDLNVPKIDTGRFGG
jgi:hypothetical protein